LQLLRTNADLGAITKDVYIKRDLEFLLIDMLNGIPKNYDITCVTVMSDPVYLNIFEGGLFIRIIAVPIVMIVVDENEDLFSPNFYTLESMRQAKRDGCNVYIIMMANGLQVTRLLRFGDRYRLLDTRAKYIMLHDIRLFHSDLHYLWKRIVNVIFIRYHQATGIQNNKSWFDLSTVPFPNPIRGVFVSRRVDICTNGKFHYKRDLFADKTKNLNQEVLNVVYLDHVPSVVVMKTNESSKVSGVEIEILNTLAEKMNFKPKLYQPFNIEVHKWGYRQRNGSFSGLLGEMAEDKADVALGNLQYTPYHLELTDLSIPYTSQCWTFLTPEALSDNSWKTLILPFKLYLWIAVLLVLLVTGTIFYGMAKYYIHLLDYKNTNRRDNKIAAEKDDPIYDVKPVGLYVFGEIVNSILYTYGMLLVVSLPKLPTGWSIRLLTGWYWLYCILLVVSYRASMTAILANPAPRVTIDTLKELIDSKIACGGWGTETKRFFIESLDDLGQKIGERFVETNDPDKAADQVAKGVFAYYDSANYLKHLSVKRKNSLRHMTSHDTNDNSITSVMAVKNNDESERNLHIMTDCVVNIPICIGFHMNSPLKPLADVYLRRIVEVGLVEKWLNDAMHRIRSLDTSEEEIKAVMNLKKLYCAFVALAIGYSLSFLSLIGEYIHWNFVVKRDPTFDKYAIDIYYLNKNKKQ
ncbi:glutamate receptor ionotropic, kainate 3-like, partial [Epargyreus clarus]|uniref:glutamate receptor ionotropic, kainate 3-like n=1 Tax=Epargyreus clarus TaxID=520877 RepID=UPI003C2E7F70